MVKGTWMLLIVLFVGWELGVVGEVQAATVSQITTNHPRIYLTGSTVAAIRNKASGAYSADYALLTGNTDGLSEAFRYLMLGNENDAKAALAAALTWISDLNTMKSGGQPQERFVSRNVYKIGLVYDWIYNSPSVSAADKQALRAGLMSGLDWLDCRDTSGVQYTCSSGSFPASPYLSRTRVWDSHPTEITGQMLVSLIAMTHDFTSGEASLQSREEGYAQYLLGVVDTGWLPMFQKTMQADGGWWMGNNYNGVNINPQYSSYAAILTATGQNIFAANPYLERQIYAMLYAILDKNRGVIMSEEDTPLPYFRNTHFKLATMIGYFYHNPYAKWLAEQIQGPWAQVYNGFSEETSEDLIYKIVFGDPTLVATPPDNLPLNAAFSGMGIYISRTGWNPSDTVVLFRNMPYFHYGHSHQANSYFTIYKDGWLALNSGHYQSSPDQDVYYFHRNISGNSVMIGAKTDGNSFLATNNPYSVDPFTVNYAANTYMGTLDYTYLQADVTNSYKQGVFPLTNQPTTADVCTHCQRNYLFLRNIAGWSDPVLVVADDYTGTNVYPKSWLLHTENLPSIAGTSITNSEGNGKLMTTILLSSEVSANLVGGTGNEFTSWNGINYPFTSIPWHCPDCKYGVWRVEISPKTNHLRDNFLQVLMPTASTTSSAPNVQDRSSTTLLIAQINNKIAVFPRDSALYLTSGSYQIPSGTYTSLTHYLTGLVPAGKYTINGQVYTANSSGVLVFSQNQTTTTTYTFTYTNTTGISVDEPYYYPVTGQTSPTPSLSPTPTPVPGCVVTGNNYTNNPLTIQTGIFSAVFKAQVSASPFDAIVGLSAGPALAFTDLATIVRFNTSGLIDVRNGGAYTADASVPFEANTLYYFRVEIDVPQSTYSVFVRSPNQNEIELAHNYAFRTEQNGVGSLANWSSFTNTTFTGTIGVCNFLLGPTVKQTLQSWLNPYNSFDFAKLW